MLLGEEMGDINSACVREHLSEERMGGSKQETLCVF